MISDDDTDLCFDAREDLPLSWLLHATLVTHFLSLTLFACEPRVVVKISMTVSRDQ